MQNTKYRRNLVRVPRVCNSSLLHNFESESIRSNCSLNFLPEVFDVIFYSHNTPNWYELAEKLNSQKNREDMLNYSMPYIYIAAVKNNDIFSNGSHLEWRVGLSNTILKGNNQSTTLAKFGIIWFKGFTGE